MLFKFVTLYYTNEHIYIFRSSYHSPITVRSVRDFYKGCCKEFQLVKNLVTF